MATISTPTPRSGPPSLVSDRFLSDRSLLRFIFPTSDTNRRKVTVTLPFFENIKIQEGGKARLAKHEILSRNGELFTYTGAESRRITLSFNLTLPHIEAQTLNINQFIKMGASNGDTNAILRKSMRAYGKQKFETTMQDEVKKDVKKHLAKVRKEARLATLDPDITKQQERDINRKAGKAILAAKRGGHQEIFELQEVFDKQHEIPTLISWWVNIIRASVMNNARDPRLGPPMIILKHGILFRDVVFLCEAVKLNFDDSAGIDLLTLLNRQIKITMNLVEVRIGDFTEYKIQDHIKGNNLAGWEAVLDVGTMDPNNDTLFDIIDEVFEPLGNPDII